MAMIKCSECGRDISDKALSCVGCGAPIAATATGSLILKDDNEGHSLIGNGDTASKLKDAFGKFSGDASRYLKEGFEDAKKVGKDVKGKLGQASDNVTDSIKEHLKSQSENEAPNAKTTSGNGKASESELNCQRFKAAVTSTIDIRYAEIMRGKSDVDRCLTYVDGQVMTASVRNIFISALGSTPPQIEVSCNLSDAILAPSSAEQQRLIKGVIGTVGGASGIGLIIAAVGTALGWGVGVVGTVTAVFAGAHVVGPIGTGVAGLTLAAIAAYFATTSNKHTDTERFLRVLKSSVNSAIDTIWSEHGEALSKVVKRESTT